MKQPVLLLIMIVNIFLTWYTVFFFLSIYFSSLTHELNFKLNHSSSSSFVRGGFGRVSTNSNQNNNNNNNNGGSSSKTPSECYNCIEEMSFSSSAGNQQRRRSTATPSPSENSRNSCGNTPPIKAAAAFTSTNAAPKDNATVGNGKKSGGRDTPSLKTDMKCNNVATPQISGTKCESGHNRGRMRVRHSLTREYMGKHSSSTQRSTLLRKEAGVSVLVLVMVIMLVIHCQN